MRQSLQSPGIYVLRDKYWLADFRLVNTYVVTAVERCVDTVKRYGQNARKSTLEHEKCPPNRRVIPTRPNLRNKTVRLLHTKKVVGKCAIIR